MFAVLLAQTINKKLQKNVESLMKDYNVNISIFIKSLKNRQGCANNC